MSDEHLSTGWEPDVAADDTVQRAFLFGLADMVADGAVAVGGQAVRTDAAVIVDARTDCPFDNAVVLLRPPVEVDFDAVVAQAAEVVPPDRSCLLMSGWPLPARRPPGWGLVGHPPFMVRPPGGTSPAPPAELRIEEVGDDDARQADFARVLCEGFPVPAAGVLGDARSRTPPLRLFVGYEDGRPVTEAGAYTAHGVNGVHSVATLPDARGRRYGEAVTWAATLADPSLPAALLASDPGRPVYERMGYLPVHRFTLWQRTARAGG